MFVRINFLTNQQNQMLKLILITAIFLITNLKAQEMNSIDNYKKIVNEVKTKFAPDKRTAIFNVEVTQAEDKIILKGETNLPEAKEKLLSKIIDKNLIDEIELLPEKSLGENIFGIVNLSVANIRTAHENSAEMATQALMGTPVKIYKKFHGWFLAQTPDNYIGWIDNDGVQLMDDNEFTDWRNSKKAIVTVSYGFSRTSPDEKSLPVSDIVEGDIFKFLSEDGNYFKVEYPDKRIAFISSDKIQGYAEWLSSREITSKNILSTAESFMGIPYLWGGTSAKAFDCSGFTKTVYYLNGVMLPRDASQQVHTGEIVNTENGFENLQTGDLLFFGRKATDSTSEKVTHVALYIGNMEFIHASGRVRINSLDKNQYNFSEYRFNSFIRAKRILTSLDKNGIRKLQSIKYYSK